MIIGLWTTLRRCFGPLTAHCCSWPISWPVIVAVDQSAVSVSTAVRATPDLLSHSPDTLDACYRARFHTSVALFMHHSSQVAYHRKHRPLLSSSLLSQSPFRARVGVGVGATSSDVRLRGPRATSTSMPTTEPPCYVHEQAYNWLHQFLDNDGSFVLKHTRKKPKNVIS